MTSPEKEEEYREESDLLGKHKIPKNALYGKYQIQI